MLPGAYEDPGEELYYITVDYRKKKWGKLEGGTELVDTRTVRSAVEDIPDLYDLLFHRHTRLRNVYFHCRQRHYAPVRQVHSPKVGRNDPCPCGSGKKYKNCCLRNFEN
jgi:uncharacterized protein YchJ